MGYGQAAYECNNGTSTVEGSPHVYGAQRNPPSEKLMWHLGTKFHTQNPVPGLQMPCIWLLPPYL